MLLRGERQAWTLNAEGHYTQLRPQASGDRPEHLGAQHALMTQTQRRATQPAERGIGDALGPRR